MQANSLAKNPEMAPLLHESLADAPFWLAPVPRKAGLAATPETHAAILGWRNDHLQIGLCAFFYMVLLAIQFRVAIFGLTLTDTFGSGHERWLAPFLSFVFCFSTLATIANVFMPRTLADSSPLETMGWSTSRRRFLTGAITGTLALSLLIISSRLPITVLTRSPRFRLRTHPRSEVLAIQSRGLHLNKHTRIAHYILDSGQILGVSHINVERLVPLKFTDLKLPPYIPHVHMSRTSATFELTALKYVKTEDYKSACEALKTGIEYDSIVLTNVNKGPDFRLYDLLAGLAVRYELPTYLKDLSAQLSNNKTSQTTSRHRTALGDRLKKWQNPKNKWHAKWADKSKKIVWCALPMQDTRSAGNGRSSRPHTTPFRVSI
ncbi:MAG: hypothetical protein IPH22_06490 [Nitrosomonas sp.]|nr:hypothetical protein [Nitrosomonas sp.]